MGTIREMINNIGHGNSYQEVGDIIPPGLLSKGGIMLVAEYPGMGYSLLARQTAYELAAGRRWLGLFTAKLSRVLFLELDNQSLTTRERFHSITWKTEYAELDGRLTYFDDGPLRLDTIPGTAKLDRLICATRANVVVVNSLGQTMKNEGLVSTKSSLRACRDLALKHGIGFILFHSLLKTSLFGTARVKGQNRSLLHIRNLRGSGIIADWTDTVVAIDAAGDQRELVFLKHSISPARLVGLRKPLIFDFDPGSAVPYRPARGTDRVLASGLSSEGN